MTGSIFVDGIGGGSVAASAVNQTDSTTQGFLIPRMTTAQRTAIAAPATSLLVYDTTLSAYYAYIGAAWIAIVTSGGTSGTDVTLTPGADARNVVQPTGDFIALVIKNNASQVKAPFQLQSSAGAVNIQASVLGGLTVNEQGNDADTRIEGDTDANLLFLDASADAVGIGTAAPTGKLTILKGAAATAGADLVTNGTFAVDANWTKGTGWTISGGAANKSAGTGSSLTQDLGEASGNMYRVRFDYTRSAGTLSVSIGGVTHVTTFSSASGSGDLYILATGTGDLSFTGDATFAGTVDNAVVNLLTVSQSALTGLDNAGSTNTELRALTQALNNLFFGRSAGGYTTTGSGNLGFGSTALAGNTTGANNVALGSASLLANTTGTSNVAIGVSALAGNATGASNVGIGSSALLANTTGSFNFALGGSALSAATTASNNVAIGINAMSATTTGGANNGIGSNTLGGNTTGVNNTGVGHQALRWSSTGNFNTAIGTQAGGFNLGTAQTGMDNNTLIGYRAGYNLTASQDDTVFVGYQAGLAETGSNAIVIGSGAVGKGANIIVIGNASHTQAWLSGMFFPQQYTTAGTPAWSAGIVGAVIFDTTLNKLRVAGVAAWETVTSV